MLMTTTISAGFIATFSVTLLAMLALAVAGTRRVNSASDFSFHFLRNSVLNFS